MTTEYRHLGMYSDWVRAARPPHLYGARDTPEHVKLQVRECLGLTGEAEGAPSVTVERRWEKDGVAGEEVSWSVGYGPLTSGYVLKPVGADRPLPGVLALHGHDGFKYYGKEKVADGPGGTPPAVVALRHELYEGRALANEMARSGFVVLAHDVFLWGSRRFPLEHMPEQIRRMVEPPDSDGEPATGAVSVTGYNAAARHHEHVIEKYAVLLGTSLAGVVSHEDRVAAAYLHSRSDVIGNQIGCAGLSGGGCRAALLTATSELIGAAVVVGMMSSYGGLLDHNVADHTWMFFPPGWARHGDWPDLAACRAPSPMLVQYDRDDQLFTPEGMSVAHRKLVELYAAARGAGNYVGQFYDGPHRFDRHMQEAAFAWLHRHLDPMSP
jgi:dienelactone hydrolase